MRPARGVTPVGRDTANTASASTYLADPPAAWVASVLLSHTAEWTKAKAASLSSVVYMFTGQRRDTAVHAKLRSVLYSIVDGEGAQSVH